MSLSIVRKGKQLMDFSVSYSLVHLMGQLVESDFEAMSEQIFKGRKAKHTLPVEVYTIQAIHAVNARYLRGGDTQSILDGAFIDEFGNTTLRGFWEAAEPEMRREVCNEAFVIISAERQDLARRFDSAAKRWRVRPDDPDPDAKPDPDDIPF